MVVKIQRTKHQFQFSAQNDTVSFPIVANPLLSESTDGFRPMELLLAGLGGCMSIDVLNILYKQKQDIQSYEIEVSGIRNDDTLAVFKSIDMVIRLKGKIDAQKAERAIKLTEEKYCSVYHSLNPAIKINSSFIILD